MGPTMSISIGIGIDLGGLGETGSILETGFAANGAVFSCNGITFSCTGII